MNDREKVMKGLKSCVKSKDESCPKECPFFADCFVYDTKPNAIYPVIEAALGILEPKTVLNKEKFFVSGFTEGKCPTCKEKILTTKDNPTRFCKYCGQELTWDA